MVYHNPGRAQVRLGAETLAEIGVIGGVAALKDSSGDKNLVGELKRISDFPILSGDDWTTFETMRQSCYRQNIVKNLLSLILTVKSRNEYEVFAVFIFLSQLMHLQQYFC